MLYFLPNIAYFLETIALSNIFLYVNAYCSAWIFSVTQVLHQQLIDSVMKQLDHQEFSEKSEQLFSKSKLLHVFMSVADQLKFIIKYLSQEVMIRSYFVIHQKSIHSMKTKNENYEWVWISDSLQ